MSEYQYYEFQAIDRPLTQKEQDDIRQISSRVQLTATQAIFVYNYGDFRGKPEQVLTQYFDMMLYVANWGTWKLLFRLPRAIANPEWFRPYELDNAITVSTTAEFVVLSITIHEEEGPDGWLEGEGWMADLLPLRDQLLQGDLRLLYLAWLRAVLSQAGADEDPLEPPVPPNLGQLSAPLQSFIEFVQMDPAWVATAAVDSPQQAIAQTNLEDWLPALPQDEQQDFLRQLVRREPHVDLQLIRRLKELASSAQAGPTTIPGQRRLSDLEKMVETVATQRQQQEQEAAQKKRIQQLKALAPREMELWEQVSKLIARKQTQTYDEAVDLLRDLRDLAEYQGRSPQFVQRFEQLKAANQKRSALIERLKKIS